MVFDLTALLSTDFDFHVEFRVLNKKAAQKSGFFIDLGHLTFISQLLQTIDITAIILILI